MADAPKARTAMADLPDPMGRLLDQQNPSLLMGARARRRAQLTDRVAKVEKVADEKIGARRTPRCG